MQKVKGQRHMRSNLNLDLAEASFSTPLGRIIFFLVSSMASFLAVSFTSNDSRIMYRDFTLIALTCWPFVVGWC